MCKYLDLAKEGHCNANGEKCPYVYFCTKRNVWKPLSSMPDVCKIAENFEIPNGYYEVCFQKRGNLYVNIDGHIKIIPNPFEDVPKYVKAYQLKSGKWRVKK